MGCPTSDYLWYMAQKVGNLSEFAFIIIILRGTKTEWSLGKLFFTLCNRTNYLEDYPVTKMELFICTMTMFFCVGQCESLTEYSWHSDWDTLIIVNNMNDHICCIADSRYTDLLYWGWAIFQETFFFNFRPPVLYSSSTAPSITFGRNCRVSHGRHF